MIKPEIGMPVLYWECGGTRPHVGFIQRVQPGGEVDIDFASGARVPGVKLRPGCGNENEIGHTSEALCEFPQWFVRLMELEERMRHAPTFLPPVFVNEPMRHWRDDLPVAGVSVAFPMEGSVQPTSQVLG